VMPTFPPLDNASTSSVRRRNWRQTISSRSWAWTNRAVRAARACFSGDLRGVRVHEPPFGTKTGPTLKEAGENARAASIQVQRRVERFCARSTAPLPSPTESFNRLTKTKPSASSFSGGPDGTASQQVAGIPSRGEVVPLVPLEVALPPAGNQPQDMPKYSQRASFYFGRGKEEMLVPEEELDYDDIGQTPQYGDPSLKVQSIALQLALLMYCAGMIGFAEHYVCGLAIFTVFKKIRPDGRRETRPVLDCRKANKFFRKPPKARMASPGAVSHLDLAPDITNGCVVTSCAGDIPVFFYTLKLARFLLCYFVLEGITTQELIDYGREHGVFVDADPILTPFVALQVCPMGWSWAPLLAQWVLEEVLQSSGLGLSPDRLLSEGRGTPRLDVVPMLLGIHRRLFGDDFTQIAGRVGTYACTAIWGKTGKTHPGR
jgi:hypothetical protein